MGRSFRSELSKLHTRNISYSQEKQKSDKFQNSIAGVIREQAKLDDQYDTVTTEIEKDMERLDIASKTATDSELEVSALVRRLQLLEEETARVNERLQETVSKLTTVEKSAEENERHRKILEASSFSNEERGE